MWVFCEHRWKAVDPLQTDTSWFASPCPGWWHSSFKNTSAVALNVLYLSSQRDQEVKLLRLMSSCIWAETLGGPPVPQALRIHYSPSHLKEQNLNLEALSMLSLSVIPVFLCMLMHYKNVIDAVGKQWAHWVLVVNTKFNFKNE